MNKPILLPSEIVDSVCNPVGQNSPCTFLRFINDSCHRIRQTSIEDELNVVRTEAGHPPLHGNCCGYPLCLPNIVVSPDLYPPIQFIAQFGEKTIHVNIKYTDWIKFRVHAIKNRQDVRLYIHDLIVTTLKRLFGG
ncbi:MAG: hypothetical protein V4686_00865 [Patescibacteria group bacterium]